MGNPATLQSNVFSSTNQPENRGRPKGVRNRATILREILPLERKTKNPLTDETEVLEVEREMELAIFKQALEGDVRAYNAVKDNVYGMLTDRIEVTNEPSQADFVRIAIEWAQQFYQVLPRDNFFELLNELFPEAPPEELIAALKGDAIDAEATEIN